MPVTYSIDPVERLVRNVGFGVLTDNDMRETQRRMVADPEFHPGYSQLFDLTAVSEIRLTTAWIREMANASAFAPGARRALIVNQALLYGLSRMFQAYLGEGGEAFGVFYTRQEAEAWLEAGRSQ
jgi:hypothetical protein